MSSRSKPKSNVALLTEGQGYIQRAKKERRDQVEEIKFDDVARHDWLSGFSKRKKAKLEERKSKAKEREKKEHLEQRRKARQELKERAAQNVKSARIAMGLEVEAESDDEDEEDDDGGDEGDDGNAIAGPSRNHQEALYEDDDQLATVVITEDFDPSNTLNPLPPPRPSDSHPNQAGQPSSKPPTTTKPKLPKLPASSHRASLKAKREKEEKKKSTSMETKSERKLGRAMEAKRRSEKASLAMDRSGGKRRGSGKDSKGKGKAKGKSAPKGKKGRR